MMADNAFMVGLVDLAPYFVGGVGIVSGIAWLAWTRYERVQAGRVASPSEPKPKQEVTTSRSGR